MTAKKNEDIASKALYAEIDNAAKNGDFKYFIRKQIPRSTTTNLLSFGYDLYFNKEESSWIISWGDPKGIVYIKENFRSDYESATLDEVYK